MRLLFGLAPGGVCHALDVTTEAVRSYRTFSPLPTFACEGTACCAPTNHHVEGLCVFCGTFRRVAPPGRYPAPCPVESGLSSPRAWRRATVQPAPHDLTIHSAICEVNALGRTRRFSEPRSPLRARLRGPRHTEQTEEQHCMRVRVMNREPRGHGQEPPPHRLPPQATAPAQPRLSRSPVVPPRQGRRRGSG